MFWAARTARTLLSLTFFSLVISEVQRVDITPDKGTTLSFSSSPSTGSGCKVCTRVQSERQCDVHSTFNTGPVSVELECLKRQGPFNVEVSRTIDCTTKSCSSEIQTTTNYDALLSLNRKFVWNLTAVAPKSARIDFGRTGLRQIQPSESCPDKHIFTYEVFPDSGKVLVGRYCNSGPITNAQALGSSRFSLELPAEQKPQNIHFDVSNGEEIKLLCDVDLSQMDLSLHLKKLNPLCIMKQKSVPIDQTTLMPGSITQMSFEACLPKDIQITASKKIDCSQARTYRRSSQRHSLSIPPLPECLPAPLSNMTWSLRLPQHGTVELGCASGTLFQELPGQPCNDSISIKMAEDDGSTIGTFCRNGSITKLQIHTNITITVSGTDGNTLLPSDILHAHVKEEISERYIFRVSPREDTPLFLATPGWPKGMPPHSTVSWIVTVPPKMEAHLRFTELNQPKCSKRHTNIHVQRLGSLEEEYSRREDETPEYDIKVSESFYLNMSNCMPVKDYFSVLTKVTLKKNQLMTIIVAIVAVLLVIFIAVLVVVCLVIRKKKKKLNHQVSIYNPNGTSFLPGQNGFPKSQEDDEYHIYDDIQDSLVYSHLLRKGAEMGIYGDFDSEPSHSDSQQPLEARESGEGGGIEVSEYQGFSEQENPKLPPRNASHVQPMVDNDLYEMGVSEGERSPSLGPRLDPDGGELTP